MNFPFKRWYEDWKEKKAIETYIEGFDWAAGVLLRGDMGPVEVQRWYQTNEH